MSTDTEHVITESAITQLYDQWLDAVRKPAVDAIVACYTEDIVAYDAILALQFKGKEAYRKHWQACMENCPGGDKTLVFKLRDLQIHAADDVAFVHGLIQCGFQEAEKIDASWMRMSAGLRREGGQWLIAHEHFSAPFDMPSGKAMFHLDPDDDGSRPRAIPAGMSTITAHLVCGDAPAAMDFYKKAFNAFERPHGRLELNGVFLHGELIIGDSVIMLAQEDERCGSASPLSLKGTPVNLHLYVQDVDHAFHQAISAGAKEVMPPTDMFWGDRYGVLEDPFGHRWSLATHVRDLTPEEISQAAREFCSPG